MTDDDGEHVHVWRDRPVMVWSDERGQVCACGKRRGVLDE